MTKKPQIEYYQNLLKNDNEVLLLKSQNSFYKTHYKGSPLNVITGFEGTAGEAVLEKSGKVTLFVDTRYHKLVDKQAFSDILIYKMPFGETYMQAFKKQFPKATKFYLPSDIKFLDYLAFEKHFEVELYKVEDVFLKNDDINSNSSIFKVDLKRSFQEKIKDVKFARFLVMDLDIISYFVNLRSFRMKYSSNFEAYLYIDKINEKYVLFADNAPQVENLEIKPIAEFENYISTIQDDIYVDFSDISCEILKSIQNPQKMPDNSLNVLASIKTEDEIDVIKKAFSLLDCSILELKNKVKQGMSEFDLVNLFEDELFKKGFSALSFKTILSIDENTASIHYSSYDKNKLLNPESLYLLDCGGYLKEGYATDITRTFYFGKNPNPLYKKIYTAVLKAFIECFLSKEKQAALLN
ncbi:aminopeptidase P family protein, partial [bacterium]|nr:aminopeptidase P family protein [bacterium]